MSRPAAAASNDRYQDYIMATGAVSINPRVQTDGVWLLDYKAGKFSGVCGAYYSCTNACSCTDNACRSRCTIDAPCQQCVGGFATCKQGCVVPACASGSSGASGTSGTVNGTQCAALASCCARIGDSETQTACTSTKDSVGGSESACQAAYDAYKGHCP